VQELYVYQFSVQPIFVRAAGITKSKLNKVFYIKYQNITRGYSDEVEAHLALDEVEAQFTVHSSLT